MTENTLLCKHIYRRGVKKGENCNKKCREVRESGMCAEHDKMKINNIIEIECFEDDITKPELFEIKDRISSESKPLARETSLFYITTLLINQTRVKGLPLMTLLNQGEVWQLMQGVDYEHTNMDGVVTNLHLVRL